LWAQETWCEGYPGTADPYLYRATYEGGCDHKWRSSTSMPRRASRLAFEVLSRRIVLLHAISEEDAWAEGIEKCDGMFGDAEITRAALTAGVPVDDGRALYVAFWDATNGKIAPWASGPYVWVVNFRRVLS